MIICDNTISNLDIPLHTRFFTEPVLSTISDYRSRYTGVETSFIKTKDGSNIAYHTYGNGPKNVIFLKGTGAAGISKIGLNQKYDGDKWTVVGIDTRGVGQSTPNILHKTDHINMETMISDIEEVADKAFGKDVPFYVQGASTGSSVAVQCTKQNPKRVLGTILEVPFLSTDAEFESGFLETGKLHEACQNFGYEPLFEDYMTSLHSADSKNWRYMAGESCYRIHRGEVEFAKKFLKAHAVGTISGEQIEGMIKNVDRGFRIMPKHTFAHAMTLAYFMANEGFVKGNTVIEGIENISDKLHVVAAKNDVIAHTDLAIRPMIEAGKISKDRVIIIPGANHGSYRLINPKIRQITDKLAIA